MKPNADLSSFQGFRRCPNLSLPVRSEARREDFLVAAGQPKTRNQGFLWDCIDAKKTDETCDCNCYCCCCFCRCCHRLCRCRCSHCGQCLRAIAVLTLMWSWSPSSSSSSLLLLLLLGLWSRRLWLWPRLSCLSSDSSVSSVFIRSVLTL